MSRMILAVALILVAASVVRAEPAATADLKGDKPRCKEITLDPDGNYDCDGVRFITAAPESPEPADVVIRATGATIYPADPSGTDTVCSGMAGGPYSCDVGWLRGPAKQTRDCASGEEAADSGHVPCGARWHLFFGFVQNFSAALALTDSRFSFGTLDECTAVARTIGDQETGNVERVSVRWTCVPDRVR